MGGQVRGGLLQEPHGGSIRGHGSFRRVFPCGGHLPTRTPVAGIFLGFPLEVSTRFPPDRPGFPLGAFRLCAAWKQGCSRHRPGVFFVAVRPVGKKSARDDRSGSCGLSASVFGSAPDIWLNDESCVFARAWGFR